MASSCTRKISGWTSGVVSSWKGWSDIEGSSQGDDAVAIPGGVQGMPECGTRCCGLSGKVVISHRLDSITQV